MKKLIYLILFTIILPGLLHSQISSSSLNLHFSKRAEINTIRIIKPGLGINIEDSLYFSEVINQLNKADRLAGTGIAFGAIANLSILINVSVLSGELEGYQGLIGMVGLGAGATRLVLSFITPTQLRLAEEMLLLPGKSVWNEYQIENSLKHIRIARNASIAVPLIGLAGFGLITGGIFGIGNGNDAGYVCWGLGWACAVAGLTTSIVSSTHISKAQKILESPSGNLNVGISSQGVGLSFSWH